VRSFNGRRQRPEIVTRGIPRPRPAWIERATSADHKSVGLLYIGTALVFAALAVAELVLMRIQLIVPESTIISPEIFNQLLTVGGTTAVILFAIPLALGLIGYLVPLQIGARGVALPRLNLLSYWLYAAGAVAVYASFLYAPSDAGPIAMAPLSEAAFSPSNGVDAWIAGVGLATAGFVLFAINLIATVSGMRAPGLAWRRVPPFTWAASASAWVLAVVGPAMIAALAMLFIDRNFGGIFFSAGDGGGPLLYQHLAAIYSTGLMAVALVVAAGVISEILPALAGKPLLSHRATAASLVAIAVLMPLAWIQGMYAAPLGAAWTTGAMAIALALVLPFGTLIYIWLATLWGGAIRLRASALFALGAISTLAFALGLELALAVIPVGWLLDGTAAALAAGTYAIVAASVLAGFAGLHHWFGKLTGRQLGEGVGKAALAIIVLGVHLYAIPMLLAGVDGQPADVFQYFEGTGVSGYNLVASIGAFVLAIGVLVELGNVAHSYGHGRPAAHDPWGGTSLEWFALSPPPPHNFDVVPDVRSPEPMRDIREAIRMRTETFAPPASHRRARPAEREEAEQTDSSGTPVA